MSNGLWATHLDFYLISFKCFHLIQLAHCTVDLVHWFMVAIVVIVIMINMEINLSSSIWAYISLCTHHYHHNIRYHFYCKLAFYSVHNVIIFLEPREPSTKMDRHCTVYDLTTGGYLEIPFRDCCSRSMWASFPSILLHFNRIILNFKLAFRFSCTLLCLWIELKLDRVGWFNCPIENQKGRSLIWLFFLVVCQNSFA